LNDRFISVVLPFRNASSTIDAALSGLTLGDEALEVLCIDDGSVDGGAIRVRDWATKDPRVRLIQGEGRGLAVALQQGVDHARGGLLARMDADDLSLPGRLAEQRRFLEQNPEVALVGTRVEAFCDGGTTGEGLERYVAWQNSLLTAEDHRREMFVESPLCHPSIMLRRSAMLAVGGYRALPLPEDYDLFLRLDQQGHAMCKLPGVFLRWRHRPGRATFSDPRYSLDSMREAKAPFLAVRIGQCRKPRKVLWGAGPTGKRMARALERSGIHFDLFIDVDPDKIGRTARGRPIASMDALDAETDLVVAAVGARGARELIRPALAARGFREGDDYWFAA
jgi:glycosyltransferase involved in cell wall biosynthesis